MKIYTRTGDEGTTATFGGDRVSKSHPRIIAYGTVDETNSFIGLARSFAGDLPDSQLLSDLLASVQSDLLVVGADLATPPDSKATATRIAQSHIDRLEAEIDRLEADLEPLKQFILPGGTRTASALHVARTVCRRAERRVVEAGESESISSGAAIYLNRLSDFLFVAARWANKVQGGDEITWSPPS